MGTNNRLQVAKYMAHGSTEPHQLEENVPRNRLYEEAFYNFP